MDATKISPVSCLMSYLLQIIRGIGRWADFCSENSPRYFCVLSRLLKVQIPSSHVACHLIQACLRVVSSFSSSSYSVGTSEPRSCQSSIFTLAMQPIFSRCSVWRQEVSSDSLEGSHPRLTSCCLHGKRDSEGRDRANSSLPQFRDMQKEDVCS
jgi:hypothetical protein